MNCKNCNCITCCQMRQMQMATAQELSNRQYAELIENYVQKQIAQKQKEKEEIKTVKLSEWNELMNRFDQAITAIESAGYKIDKYILCVAKNGNTMPMSEDTLSKYRHIWRATDKHSYSISKLTPVGYSEYNLSLKSNLTENEVIEFARKCQLKDWW